MLVLPEDAVAKGCEEEEKEEEEEEEEEAAAAAVDAAIEVDGRMEVEVEMEVEVGVTRRTSSQHTPQLTNLERTEGKTETK